MWDDTDNKKTKQYNISQFKKKNKFEQDDLKKVNNIFRVVISGSDWERNKLQNDKKNIEVVKKGEKVKKYGNLKQILRKYQGQITELTNYFVGKATDSKKVKEDFLLYVDITKSFQCALKISDSHETTKKNKNCTITQFANSESRQDTESGYDKLEFSKPTTNTINFSEHKHYLIKFDDSKKQQINDIEKVIICDFHEFVGNHKKNIKFTKVKDVFYDGTSDYIFTF